MNRHTRRKLARQARSDDHDEAQVVVCAGPPTCLLEGDDAVANAQAGCPQCRRIVIGADGSEREYKINAN